MPYPQGQLSVRAQGRSAPGIQKAGPAVRLGPQPAEAPARGAREKAKASLVSPGVQSGVGGNVLRAWTPRGTPPPHLSSCEPVHGGRREKAPVAADLLGPRPRHNWNPTRPQLDIDRAMRGPSVALWLFLALRTGEAPPPGSGSRSRGGGSGALQRH